MDYFTGSFDCTDRGIPNGHVLHDYCYSDSRTVCPYYCSDGYKSSDIAVVCNKASQRWETKFGRQHPCIATRRTTRAPFNFDIPTVPSAIPFEFPTRRWMTFTLPTFIPQFPSVWPTYEPVRPFNFNNVPNVFPVDSYTTTPNPEEDASATVTIFAIIMAIIIGSVVILALCCACLKCAAARRRAKTRARATRNLVILHNAYSPPSHGRLQTDSETSISNIQSNASSSRASNILTNPVSDNTASSPSGDISDTYPRAQQNNEEGRELGFLYIRRFIHIFRNPVPPVHNPPEPPPYDAESAPPPTYEDVTSGGSSTFQTPSEPPPPYTITI